MQLFQIADALQIPCEDLFRLELKKQPLCRKTVREYANFLHLVCAYGAKEYNISNAAAEIKVKSGASTRKVDCIHDDQLPTLLKVLPNCSVTEQIILYTLLNLGLRRGELAGLLWSDFDFSKNTVSIEAELIYEGGYHLTTVKKGRVRSVAVAPNTWRRCTIFMVHGKCKNKGWRASWQRNGEEKSNKSRQTLSCLAGKDFIVCNDCGFPLNPDSYRKINNRVAEKASIEHFHSHMLRHTFVSIPMANPDIDLATITAQVATQARRLHSACIRKNSGAAMKRSVLAWAILFIKLNKISFQACLETCFFIYKKRLLLTAKICFSIIRHLEILLLHYGNRQKTICPLADGFSSLLLFFKNNNFF